MYYWPQDLAIRLAGLIRLETTTPRLLEIFYEGLFDEVCSQALARIGTEEIVEDVAQRFVSADLSLQGRIVWILADVYTQHSVSGRLNLVERTADTYAKTVLLPSALQHFSPEALDPARRFALQNPSHPDMRLVPRSARVLCKIMGDQCWTFEEPVSDAIYRRQRPLRPAVAS
jgi:hypothetical protein